jgi:hypothetical protein
METYFSKFHEGIAGEVRKGEESQRPFVFPPSFRTTNKQPWGSRESKL